jgi:hypothetical protein
VKYWITTHWPMPQEDDPFVGHVYVKSRHVRHPLRGDIVFVRESLTVRARSAPPPSAAAAASASPSDSPEAPAT